MHFANLATFYVNDVGLVTVRFMYGEKFVSPEGKEHVHQVEVASVAITPSLAMAFADFIKKETTPEAMKKRMLDAMTAEAARMQQPTSTLDELLAEDENISQMMKDLNRKIAENFPVKN